MPAQPMTVQEILSSVDGRIPKFARLQHQSTIDSEGRDAVYVWLVIDDDTKISPARFMNLIGASRLIEDAFTQSGLNIIPYIRYARKSEVDTLFDDVP
jgi:hypothetical protein